MTDPTLPGAEQELSDNLLQHLPTILRQRHWLVQIPVLICSLTGIGAAVLLPPRYRSTAVVLVESADLPENVSGSPLNDIIDKRIAKIQQQILSRPNLIELIQTNNLYAKERRAQSLSSVIDTMRDASLIEPVSADIDTNQRNRGGSATIAFSISFEYGEAPVAQLVAQQFTERLLKLDSSQMAQQAANTVSFLRDQATTIQGQIADVEGQIETIKGRNGLAFSSLGYNMGSSGANYEVQIASLQRENAELAAKASDVSSGNDSSVAVAEQQLATARAIYADNHPDVLLAEQKVREARANAKTRGTRSAGSVYASQIAANNATIASLNRARSAEANRTAATLSAQASAPLILEKVQQLEARADGLRANYQRVATSLLTAEATAKMESEQKGERLTLIDPPTVPEAPSWPNRPLLIAGGSILGTGIGVGLALLIELFRRPIRGAGAIQGLLGVAPLVVIPTLHNRPEKARHRWFRRLFRRKAAA